MAEMRGGIAVEVEESWVVGCCGLAREAKERSRPMDVRGLLSWVWQEVTLAWKEGKRPALGD